jgi:CRISPR/Cas system CSM-associated protein Csm3 (group 7 of RAMP superfamily)
MTLLRDPDGHFYIPAASICGAARSYLRRRLQVDARVAEPRILSVMFGDQYASLLSVWDARCTSDEVEPHIRDGVHIVSQTGIAEDEAKYNFEVLPKGTAFTFRFWLTVYQELPRSVEERELRSAFRSLLEGFVGGEGYPGDITLGAKTRKGLGTGKVTSWSIHQFDSANPEHFLAWLERDYEGGRVLRLDEVAPDPLPDVRRRLLISAKLRLKTSLLIRSAGENAASPDVLHLTENGTPVVPGTSLAGILRHRVERIAKTMLHEESAARIVESMFGPLKRDGWIPRAGRVTVNESYFAPDTFDLRVQGRVAIDRFTGGALEQHLFDEAALFPAADQRAVLALDVALDLSEELNDDSRREMALLLHAFRDLWTGDLPVGGEVGIGRGVWQGIHARLTAPGLQPLEITRRTNGQPQDLEMNLAGTDLDAWNDVGSVLAVRQEQQER